MASGQSLLLRLLDGDADEALNLLRACLALVERRNHAARVAAVRGRLGILFLRAARNEMNPIRRRDALEQAITEFSAQLDAHKVTLGVDLGNVKAYARSDPPAGSRCTPTANLVCHDDDQGHTGCHNKRQTGTADLAPAPEEGNEFLPYSKAVILARMATARSYLAAVLLLAGRPTDAIREHKAQLQYAIDTGDAIAAAAAHASLGFVHQRVESTSVRLSTDMNIFEKPYSQPPQALMLRSYSNLIALIALQVLRCELDSDPANGDYKNNALSRVRNSSPNSD